MDPPSTTDSIAAASAAADAAAAAAAAAALPHSAYAANPTPTHTSAHNHPPYAEMITAAIAALNERNGSSRKAIVKYTESNYSNLPPTHSALLSHHLKRLKNNGQILMVKYSYKLPGSGTDATVSQNGSVSDPTASAVTKKRPGRRPNSMSVQPAVPVFAQQSIPTNDAAAAIPGTADTQSAVGSVYVPVGTVGSARGRGRPPKQGGSKLGIGRPPPKSGTVQLQSGARRSRGRPKKIGTPPAARVKRLGKSRGRPRKLNNAEVPLAKGGVAAGGDGSLPVSSGEGLQEAGKRRGRPRKDGAEAKRPKTVATGDPKIPRKLGGKPLGRPKKKASATTSQTPDNQLLMAYLDLKGKLEYLQLRIQQTASVVKPHLNDETAVSALQELEMLAGMNISTSNAQHHDQPQIPDEPQTQ